MTIYILLSNQKAQKTDYRDKEIVPCPKRVHNLTTDANIHQKMDPGKDATLS